MKLIHFIETIYDVFCDLIAAFVVDFERLFGDDRMYWENPLDKSDGTTEF